MTEAGASPARCPFIVPVLADGVRAFPVSGYCDRPDGDVRVPAVETLEHFCTTSDYSTCPGYQACLARIVSLLWGAPAEPAASGGTGNSGA